MRAESDARRNVEISSNNLVQAFDGVFAAHPVNFPNCIWNMDDALFCGFGWRTGLDINVTDA
ncbi:hypothetical protein [Primorskyibacter flagellatus]|uniref:hypothetical protein n=1 Tax=Primorskyibacter flagellatus TaxID=1387277 RepID=UPI00117A40C2|nr:hypothetical protein [Primorskyibacter flagellatus]